MREVQTVFWCDWHMKTEGVRKLAGPSPHNVQIDGVEAELDFCPECAQKILGPLHDLFEAIKSRAHKVEQPQLPAPSEPPKPTLTKPPEPVRSDESQRVKTQCPLCRTWMDVRSRTSHVRKKHPQIPASKIDWRFDESIPQVWLCGCGMPFATARSRAKHVDRRVSMECSKPLNAEPVATQRPV
jgi:hypothetical protein